jgi:hypothetical protein
MSTLLLITSAPTSIHAWHAFGLAQALQQKVKDFVFSFTKMVFKLRMICNGFLMINAI